MDIQRNKKGLAVLAAAAVLGVTTLVAGAGARPAAATNAVAPDATPLTVPNPVQLSNTFTKLAKEVEPSVVQVTSTIEKKTVRFQGQQPDDLFRRFFGGNPFGDMPQQPRRSTGTGSGFIVDKNGYILTNNHVVDGATKVQVKLNDEHREYTAKVIGTDPELDLAILKIDAGHALPAVHIGNSEAVQVGDWAMAIGSPFGLEASVTAGIISAKGRELGDPDHQLQRFLQTDAAINPGNSGGPLLNINGEVVGVNTMIATSSGHFEGIGFALPINLAVNAYNQIIKTGKVSRGAIGILFNREPAPELLKVYGAKEGVFVQQVNPGGPAAEAGMKEGDVITSFNGKPVKDGEELVNQVSATPVGTSVPVTVLRDGKKIDLTLKVGDRQDIIAGRTGGGEQRPESAGEKQNVKLGVSVRNLTQSDRQSASLRAQGGVLVTSVDSGSFAEDLGLRDGDIITAINRQPVNSADDVKRIAGELKPGDPVALRVLRNAGDNWQTFFPAGTLPKS